MAETDRVGHVPPELAVAALVGAATLPMTRLFTSGLGSVALVSLGLSVAAAYVLRRSGMNAIAAWSSSTLLLMWFLAVRFFPGDLWGPFPTIDTLHSIGVAVREGARQTIEEIAPVDPTVPLLLFVSTGIWLTVWLVHAAVTWLRNPVLAIASAIPLLTVPGAIVAGTRLWFEGGLFLAAAGLVLFLDQRQVLQRMGPAGSRDLLGWRAGPAVRLGIVAVAIAAVAAPVLPGFGREPSFGGPAAGSQVYFNPIVAIKPSLDDDRDIELLRMRSPSRVYTRLTSLDSFNGKVWHERAERPVAPIARHVFQTGPGPTRKVTQEIVLGALAGRWLPAAFQPARVIGQAPEVELDDDTLVVNERLRPGIGYVVESNVPTPTAAFLDRPASYDSFVYGESLALPRGIPDQVREIAREITKDATTPYQQALALQNHLRTFAYDQNIAIGHSFSDIVTFLTEVQAGYCEQFAGSMAVMARTLGIPARVAIGFGIGDLIDTDTYRITTRHAHAWVEVYFPHAGWIIFEPTPRAGVARIPSYAPAERTGPDPGSAASSPDPTDRRSLEPEPVEPAEPEPPTFVEEARATWLPRLALLAAVLVLLMAGPAWTVLRRRARLRRAATPRAVVAAHYVDFLDWCAAAGLARGPGETPREHAARLGAGAPEASEPLARLTAAVEEALFAPPNGLDAAGAILAAAQARAAVKPLLTRRSRAKSAVRWGSWLGKP